MSIYTSEMRELTVDELDAVSGGLFAVFVVLAVASMGVIGFVGTVEGVTPAEVGAFWRGDRDWAGKY